MIWLRLFRFTTTSVRVTKPCVERVFADDTYFEFWTRFIEQEGKIDK